MSIDQKQQIANVFTWALRIVTAIGGFFLVQQYEQVKETNQLLHLHLVEQGKHNSTIDAKVEQHERDINKHDYRILRLEGLSIEAKMREHEERSQQDQ